MFTHLHTHTEYSMLDGISRIPDLVYQAKELGMESLAITDHGTLYGAVDFYSECSQTAGARSYGAGRTGRAMLVGGGPTSAGATGAGPTPTGKNRRGPLVGGRGYRAARLATLHLRRPWIDPPPPLPR